MSNKLIFQVKAIKRNTISYLLNKIKPNCYFIEDKIIEGKPVYQTLIFLKNNVQFFTLFTVHLA
jgi:hypothetical protein